MAVKPRLERAPSLATLQNALRALPGRKTLWRQCDVAFLANQRRETVYDRGERLLHIFIRETEPSSATHSIVGSVVGRALPNKTSPIRERRGIARESAAGVAAWRLRGNDEPTVQSISLSDSACTGSRPIGFSMSGAAPLGGR
jgi:hypothetical protein